MARGFPLLTAAFLLNGCGGSGIKATGDPQAAGLSVAELPSDGSYNPFDAESLRRAAVDRARQGDHSEALRRLARAFQLDRRSPANMEALRRIYGFMVATGSGTQASAIRDRPDTAGDAPYPIQPWPIPGRPSAEISPPASLPEAPATTPSPASPLPPLWNAPRR